VFVFAVSCTISFDARVVSADWVERSTTCEVSRVLVVRVLRERVVEIRVVCPGPWGERETVKG
jgi:hypothetical protein